MCGIVGYWDATGNATERNLQDMTRSLVHRGPDDEGLHYQILSEGVLGLGHRRLSILDLSPLGHQPMQWQHFTLVYNGEIYNYREIRKELQQVGHVFQTDSDTEVILHAYKAWGQACVNRFIGMFAFALFDAKAEELLLCRDRAGVKPLFWSWDGQRFLFASELKAFHNYPGFQRALSKEGVSLFMAYGYVPGPYSIYEGVSKLKPGHWLRLKLRSGAKEHIEAYWKLGDFYRQPDQSISYQEAKEALLPLLDSACQYRMVADVPVGVFLSGGYDSTLVTALVQAKANKPLKTFTIGFWQGSNEAPFAKKVAEYLGTKHHEYYCTEADAQSIIPELPYYYDEPNADISNIPTLLVSRLARKQVTVALSADGGDELFAGYTGFHAILQQYRQLADLPFGKSLALLTKLSQSILPDSTLGLSKAKKRDALIKAMQSHGKHRLNAIGEMASQPPNYLLQSLLHPDFRLSPVIPAHPAFSDQRELGQIEPGNLLLWRSFESTMTDLLLVKVDRASMAVSLEGREPLLDHRLAEFAARLPYAYKHDGQTSKKIFRDIAHDYVPREMLERPKTGFDLPLFEWLRGDLSGLINEYLSEEAIRQSGVFSLEGVEAVTKLFQNQQLRYNEMIWRVLTFQMWYQKWSSNT